jgi:CRP-like cAMP-binding protein
MYSWIFVNLANILFALAYLVKDIFWLRIISVVACAANIVYLYVGPDKPLWWGIGWDIVFVLINIVQIWILLGEKRNIHFGREEQELYEAVFNRITPLEYRRLLNAAHWEKKEIGDVLAKEGALLPVLMVIYSGAVRIEKNGKVIAILKSGDFVGEMSYVCGDKASATVIVDEHVRLLCWDKARLTRLLGNEPSLKTSIDAVLSHNMAIKLKRHV